MYIVLTIFQKIIFTHSSSFKVPILCVYRSSADGIFEWNGETIKFCESTSDCQKFINSSFGFCNFDHVTTGFCEDCIDLDLSSWTCGEQGFHCDRGLEECQSVCEGMLRLFAR